MSRRRFISVLVADDDPSVRRALEELIRGDRRLELAAVVADAAAAVKEAGRRFPDVALVDVRMPGGGANAARGIRSSSPETRVLAFTAHDDRETVLEMLEAGAVGYLVKGGDIDELVNSIERAALGQACLSVEVTGEVIDELVGQLAVRRRTELQTRRREKRIRRALDEDGVLRMEFQPICMLQGETVGVEALARFKAAPKRAPELWFAEAEEAGLRRELELAAVQAALAALTNLPSGLYLSFNVSPATIAATGFRRLLMEADGARVVVEVTEHARIADYDRLNGALARLRKLGVRLAIDDAGAGFASLHHILRLQPEFIKLDRSLIDGIQHDRSRQALAAGLISFAGKIDATIIAEGIERSDEVDALAELGVSYGQGFFFARPGPLPLKGDGSKPRRGSRAVARQ